MVIHRRAPPLQDIGGGQPRQIEGTDLDLWAMEIDVEEAKAAFMSATEVRPCAAACPGGWWLIG